QGNRRVVDDEVGRIRIVRMNAADASGRQKDSVRPGGGEPALDGGLRGQVGGLPINENNLAIFRSEPPHDRRARHPLVARNEYTPSLQVKQQRRSHIFLLTGTPSNLECDEKKLVALTVGSSYSTVEW